MASALNKVMNEVSMHSHSKSTNSNLSKEEALEILGLEKNASQERINAAYHKLMKSMHPDKGGSPYLAQKLNEARDTLLD